MSVSERDFALLSEELKCLRKKFSTMVSSAGGYTDTLTSPGSSIYPNSYYENCTCAAGDYVAPDPFNICGVTDPFNVANIGDFANGIGKGMGMFEFDRVRGVFFLANAETNWQNRSTGLTTTALEHGCVDVWWYKKQTPNVDNAILWLAGKGRILRSTNAGRIGWSNRSPSAPTGYSLSDIYFTQIVPDKFIQNRFIAVARTDGMKTWVVCTDDDGQNWNWTELTNYNGTSYRRPIWIAQGGSGGGLLWLTTWADDNLTVLKLNNDSIITVSAEYTLNAASFEHVMQAFEIMSPVSQVDTNIVWLYGRASDPQGLGLTHILRIENEGIDWYAVEQGLGDNWVGSMQVSLASGGDRNFYVVENPRI